MNCKLKINNHSPVFLIKATYDFSIKIAPRRKHWMVCKIHTLIKKNLYRHYYISR